MSKSSITLEQAQTFNVPAFILNNTIVNENNVPLTFDRHKFLVQPYMDNSPKVVAKKCGQVGFSTLAIIRSIHLAKYVGANVIYTLPSRSAVKDFVAPKVNPLIANNPTIAKMIGRTESTALKQIGDRFVYFRGSWEESAAISISAHVLFLDEVDRSNQAVLRTYRTRLDAAKLERPDLAWEYRFSNPSIPDFGVDEWWQKSDQKHWMIKCSRCNKWQYLDWPDNVDIENKRYICSKCHRPLSDEDRINGKWVKFRFGREISGYWFNQMMAVWVDVEKIIEDSEGDPSVFHNFTLGKTYVTEDMTVTRSQLVACLEPGSNPQIDNAMGVDVKSQVKHYVIGNRYGIFRVGTTDSWREVERLRNQYGAITIIDHHPHPTPVDKLVKKYPGKVFAHNYMTSPAKNNEIVVWGDKNKFGMISSDRTKIIDLLVSEINANDLVFQTTLPELDNQEYINHWENIYRTTSTNNRGVERAIWEKKEGRDDDFVHATAYFRMAIEKTLATGKVVVPKSAEEEKLHPVVAPDGTVPALELGSVIRKAGQKKKNWQSI